MAFWWLGENGCLVLIEGERFKEGVFEELGGRME